MGKAILISNIILLSAWLALVVSEQIKGQDIKFSDFIWTVLILWNIFTVYRTIQRENKQRIFHGQSNYDANWPTKYDAEIKEMDPKDFKGKTVVYKP